MAGWRRLAVGGGQMGGHGRCRHCGTELTIVLADLGETPVANDYVDPATAGPADPRYPLKVLVCSQCRLAQTQDCIGATEIFREDYAYFSSQASTLLESAHAYVDQMIERFELGPETRHVEIGSNDGYLLQFSQARGLKALGVEPCRSVAEAARAKGIETHIAFFNQAYAEQLAAEGWAADLVTANNVVAHVPDINDFVSGFRTLLKPEGVATIEVQHLLRMMQKGEFDTIYHEHFSYLSLLAAKRIFEKAGLRIFDVHEMQLHGGSLRYYVCRDEASHPETGRVDRILREELDYGLDKDDTYARWGTRVEETRLAFVDLLARLKQDGKSIAGYGAPAKACTLLNYCGIGRSVIDYTVDRAPSKQGRLIPGVRIPILAPQTINETRPAYIVILPWNWTGEIVRQLSNVEAWGGKFIVAIPRPTIFGQGYSGS